jgi:hypothetical protein
VRADPAPGRHAALTAWASRHDENGGLILSVGIAGVFVEGVMRFLVSLALLLTSAVPVLAQQVIPPDGGAYLGLVSTPATTPPLGSGGLIATTTSATVTSLYTGNANNLASWPTSGNAPRRITIRNLGTANIAFCPFGGTCTCVENGVAATNGFTIRANGDWLGFTLNNIAYNTPTIVACSGTVKVEIDQ